MHLSAQRDGNNLEVELAGSWRAVELPAIESELAALSFAGVRVIRVTVPESVQLDLAGAWALRSWLQAAQNAGADVQFTGARPGQLELIDSTLAGNVHATPPSSSEPSFEPVSALGRQVTRRVQAFKLSLDFIGRATLTFLHACTSWRRLRPASIARHVYETGITAIPIVSLIAFLITLIIAYIAAQQAREYGAEIFVVDIVTVGVLRELGVLLTAIIVAGRSGSAFAAEIGAMKLNEEVDALHAIGVEPHEVLILPRVIGLVIAMPLLAIIADGIGLASGAILCKWLLDMPLVLYLQRVQDAIAPTTFWVGVIKAPFFGLLIALSGTYRGLQVRDSSRELGRLTTVAVVQSIFLVIFANAVFAIAFWQLDI
ncbi:MAG TPA: ABC transporter permease [Steroidobacteraceae bacterium]|jgi:phospholipid/cholesterol/gamma-HCH transport system permease protein|nr:ABC transporter permease [Steroidobacteraceae bacterium]